MPQILRTAKDGRIAVKEFYTVGDLAFLMGVAHATASRLIDQGEIRGFWLPTKRRQRRIAHKNLLAFVRRHPDFRYMLDKLNGYDPRVDFPGGTEATAAHTQDRLCPSLEPGVPAVGKARSDPPGGTLLSEGSRLSPRARATDRHREVGRRVIPGLKVPATGLTTWKWRIMHGALVAFVRRNPGYSYAMDRIQGCESSSDAAPAEQAKPILLPEGAPRRPRRPRRRGRRTRPCAAASSAVPNFQTDASRL